MNAAPRHSARWERRVKSAVTERLALKASAVLLALVLWFVVAARQPTEEVASVRFVPQLDSALVLRDPSPPIRALVIGRPNEILKLANAPLAIRRPIASDAPDTLTLTLRAADVEVPDGVPSVLVRLDPDSVTVLGPRRAVAQLRFISTVVDSITVDTVPHLVDLDTARLGVSVRPAQVKALFVRNAT